MKNIKYTAFSLFLGSSCVLSMDQSYLEGRIARTPAHVKDAVFQGLNVIWDENQRLWNINSFLEERNIELETINKNYEGMLRNSIPSVNETQQFSYNPHVQILEKTELFNQEKPQNLQSLNFLDHYFPLKKDFKRSQSVTLTLAEFEGIQDAVSKLSASNESFKITLQIKQDEWTEEKKSLLNRISIIEKDKEEAENQLRYLEIKMKELEYKIRSVEKTNRQFINLNNDLQKNLLDYQAISQNLSKELQDRRENYETSLIALKAEKDSLEKEKEILEYQVVSLNQQISSYQASISQGQQSLNSYLQEEERRRKTEIKALSQGVRGDLDRVKDDKERLERTNEQLKQEIDNLERSMRKTLELAKIEKEGLLSEQNKKEQEYQKELSKIQQNNRLLEEQHAQIKRDYEIEIEKLKQSLLTQKIKEEQEKKKTLEISFEKAQEYLPYLNQTIKKAQIPFSERPKNLLQALDVIQTHFDSLG
jgi:hypothetical protein